jgi:hypothetical protein
MGFSFIFGFLVSNALLFGSFWMYDEYFPSPAADFVRYVDNAYLNRQILDLIWFLKYSIGSTILYLGLMFAIPSQTSSNRFDVSWNDDFMPERLKWFKLSQKNSAFGKI